MMKLDMVHCFSSGILGQLQPVPAETGWGLLVYHLSASAIFSALGIDDHFGVGRGLTKRCSIVLHFFSCM
ncbi:MAG: hypothetical protein LW850_05135 [Planctomycetaceae bacterium]|nr:hypothetical protein [Planctomycetaceae bacterium]